jgi:curli biogenesis system outer membrane secretion channel CsgG
MGLFLRGGVTDQNGKSSMEGPTVIDAQRTNIGEALTRPFLRLLLSVKAIVLLVVATSGVSVSADYLAYSVNEKNRSPLPMRIKKINPKYMVNLEWGQYDGKRARVGLLAIDNQSSATAYDVTLGEDEDTDEAASLPLDGIEAIITDTLARSGRFRLMEREAGQVIGAQYLVQVAITDYSSKNTKGLGGLVNRVPILNGVSAIAGEAKVGMNFRMLDALTGELVYETQVNMSIKVAGPIVGEGRLVGDVALGGFYSEYSTTPVGQAVIAAANRGVYELVGQIGTDPAEGAVIQADELEVWVNLGGDVVSMGERLEVMRKGKDLTDPETGRPLGSTSDLIGTIQVSRVQDRFSIARPVSLATMPMRGDKVISLAPPPSIEFAKKFTPPAP